MQTTRIDTPENQEFRFRLASQLAQETAERYLDAMAAARIQERQQSRTSAAVTAKSDEVKGNEIFSEV
ncbi:MAG: hypothetical protein LBT46_12635 [Planctomycetaceae bacterium]|nr:hypothetical protein [Planctomycetaceae bacterium]